MIKLIIKAIKAFREQQKQQLKLNTLLKIKKTDSVKVRLPNNYIKMIEVLAKYGVSDPYSLEGFLKEPVIFRHAKYDICQFETIIEQCTGNYPESSLRKEAIFKLVTHLMENTEAIKIEDERRTSPWHHKRRYSIKVAIERK